MPRDSSIPQTKPIWSGNSGSINRSSCQYLHWIGGLLRGDLGYSYVSEKPALDEILPRIPITARLAGLALLFSASIGIPLGVISAVNQGTRLDYALRVVSLSGLSLALILARPVDTDGLRLPVRNHADLQCESENVDRGIRDLLHSRRWRSAFAAPHLQCGSRAPRCSKSCGRITSAPPAPRERPRRPSNYHHALKKRRSAGHYGHRHRGGVPDRRLDRHRNRFQYPRRCPLSSRSAAVARLPDRPEPRDADRGGRRGSKLYGGHALRGGRPADQVYGLGASLDAINYDTELRRARRPFHARLAQAHLSCATSYPRRYRSRHHGDVRAGRGVADIISRFDPLSVDSLHRLAAPDARHWMGNRFVRPAMSGAGSSTAPAFRLPSALALPRSARPSA